MILLLALAGGLPAGLAWSWWRGHPYQVPELKVTWLAFLSFLPQFALLYLPDVREAASPRVFSSLLLTSMLALAVFSWVNRHAPGMKILLLGLILNFIVIAGNGGFMPISPGTVNELVPDATGTYQPGDRFGAKDMVYHVENTRLEWLSDRFLTPAGFSYRAAFSLGDVFIALGAFLMLAYPGFPIKKE